MKYLETSIVLDLDGCLYPKRYEVELQEKYEYPLLREFLEDRAGLNFESNEEIRNWIERLKVIHGIYAHELAIARELGIDVNKIIQDVFYQIPVERVIRKDRELSELLEQIKNRYKVTLFTERQDKYLTSRVLNALGLDLDYFDDVSTRAERLKVGDPSKYNPAVHKYVFREHKDAHYFEDNPAYLEIAKRAVSVNGNKITPVPVKDDLKEKLNAYITQTLS